MLECLTKKTIRHEMNKTPVQPMVQENMIVYSGPVRIKLRQATWPSNSDIRQDVLMMTNNIKVELNINRDMAYPSKSKTTVFENSDLGTYIPPPPPPPAIESLVYGLQFKCNG